MDNAEIRGVPALDAALAEIEFLRAECKAMREFLTGRGLYWEFVDALPKISNAALAPSPAGRKS